MPEAVVGQGREHHDRVAVRHLDRQARLDEPSFDEHPVGSGAGEQRDQLHGVDIGSVEDDESLDLGQRLSGVRDEVDEPAEERCAVALEQGQGGIGARQDRAGRARRVRRLEGGVEASRVDALTSCQHDRRLRPRRQGLVCARHEGIGPERQGVARQVRVPPEVGGPRSIDHERYAVCVGHVR